MLFLIFQLLVSINTIQDGPFSGILTDGGSNKAPPP